MCVAWKAQDDCLQPPCHSKASRRCVHLHSYVCAGGHGRTLSFKEYNFNALGLPTAGGHLHPLLKVSRAGGQQLSIGMLSHGATFSRADK